MATTEQRRELRRKFEKDSFGSGGRTAVLTNGKPSQEYFEWLEHMVAGNYRDPKPIKVSRYKQGRLFGPNKFDKSIGR